MKCIFKVVETEAVHFQNARNLADVVDVVGIGTLYVVVVAEPREFVEEIVLHGVVTKFKRLKLKLVGDKHQLRTYAECAAVNVCRDEDSAHLVDFLLQIEHRQIKGIYQ